MTPWIPLTTSVKAAEVISSSFVPVILRDGSYSGYRGDPGDSIGGSTGHIDGDNTDRGDLRNCVCNQRGRGSITSGDRNGISSEAALTTAAACRRSPRWSVS